MTKLLVSVRDAAEALIALEAGVDLIDVKEPRNGALGAADGNTLAAIIQAVDGWVPVSAACGELLQLPPTALTPAGAAFAKVGLAGCVHQADWAIRWQDFVGSLPSTVMPVAVVYADAFAAQSPPAEEIIFQAEQIGCTAVLVDTFDKSAGAITSHWSHQRIRSFVLDVRRRGMLAVVAGSLTESLITQVLEAEPDIIAVRGAACRGDRLSTLDARKVCQLRALIDPTGCGVGNASRIARAVR